MKRAIKTIILLIAILVIIFAVYYPYIKKETVDVEPSIHEVIKVVAQNPDDAAFMISEELFKTNEFDGISITETELIDYSQIKKYDKMTTTGAVYIYELIYRFQTNDERTFLENKIIPERAETNVWIDNVFLDRCVVIYENEDIYYCIMQRDMSGFNSKCDGVDSDWIECNIIKCIFENQYNIPDLSLAEDFTGDSVLNKLITDIEMHIKPTYEIDKELSKVYAFAFDDEIECIYFKADLYDANGKEILLNKNFSLFLNGGFAVYEIGGKEGYVPKDISNGTALKTTNEEFLDFLPLEFAFSSGAGGWGNVLTLNSDGTFEGEYHDSEMGSVGADYPNGTVYVSKYYGKFSDIKKINDYSYSLSLKELNLEDDEGKEWIEDGVLYISSEAYGISGCEEFILYTPKTPVCELSEEFLYWKPYDKKSDVLSFYGLYNKETEIGFFAHGE